MNLNEDESEENQKRRQEVLSSDQAKVKGYDLHTEELVKSLEVLKKIDELNEPLL